jgi:hypothetical protein
MAVEDEMDERFCFRIRFRRSPRETLGVDESSVVISTGSVPSQLKLSVAGGEASVRDSRELALTGCGFRTAAEASLGGRAWKQWMMLAFARMLVGADFGERSPSMQVTAKGLEYFADLLGAAKPVAQDSYGVSVYSAVRGAGYLRMSPPDLMVTKSLEKLTAALSRFTGSVVQLSDREEVAFQFFNASFSQADADARFFLLMTAIESLMEPKSRPQQAVKHVEKMINETSGNGDLSESDRTSMITALGFLKNDSIRQTGRQLVAERLGDRLYDGRRAERFFVECYDLRSRLVHGLEPIPTWADVNRANGTLEVFVSDLLTRPWESDREGGEEGVTHSTAN